MAGIRAAPAGRFGGRREPPWQAAAGEDPVHPVTPPGPKVACPVHVLFSFLLTLFLDTDCSGLEEPMATRTPIREIDGNEFLRQWTIPEEDRRRYIAQPWRGEFRWFRSENVIPIE